MDFHGATENGPDVTPGMQTDGPAVELDLDEHEVRIGEHGNQVHLTPIEWNVLARAIRNGEVGDLDTGEGS